MRFVILLSLFWYITLMVVSVRAEDTTTVPITTPSANTTTSTTTTTPKPEKTPTMAPSSTEPPQTTTVSPAPEVANSTNYVLKRDNVTCINITMAVQFNLNGTLVTVKDGKVPEGEKCPEDVNATQIPLEIEFNGDKLTLNFERDLKDNSTWVSKVILVHQTKNFTFVTDSLFKSPGLKGYKCSHDTVITMNNQTENKVTFTSVSISNPFHLSEHGPLNDEQSVCAADDDMNDIIPIAVGIALMALITIVLVAYCVGRRRSRRLAYQSV